MHDYHPVPSAVGGAPGARRRKIVWLSVILFFVFLLFASVNHHVSPSAIYDAYKTSGSGGAEESIPLSAFRHNNIAIAS